MNKNKFILMFAVVSCIGSKAIAADVTTHDYYTGQYPVAESVKNSIIYGHDTNVTQAHGHLSGIIAGGENNTVQLDAHNSATFGISNNNNSANSVVAGDHNTITNANNSIAAGIYNASHSSNTLVFGYNNAINFRSENSFAGGERTKLTGKNSFVFGEDAEVENDNTYTIGKKSKVTAENSVAIGNSAEATIDNSVALGSNAKTDTIVNTTSIAINNNVYTVAGTTPVGTVSIGDINKEKTITNIAAGRVSNTSTDAINGSQLHAVVSEVENNTNGIKMNADAIKELASVSNNNVIEINNNLNALDNRINANQKEARKGIASVSALAALHPLDYNPDHKVDIMAGVGHYRGNTAVALGVAYRPNGNTMFTVGASINDKDTAINAGLSYKVGTKDIQYRSPASMAKDIDDLKAIVNQLVQENEALKNQKK
jgi:autotransporter adhesin|nr:MAG TPA: hypothetical protein [Caudoviricetes sp.]